MIHASAPHLGVSLRWSITTTTTTTTTATTTNTTNTTTAAAAATAITTAAAALLELTLELGQARTERALGVITQLRGLACVKVLERGVHLAADRLAQVEPI